MEAAEVLEGLAPGDLVLLGVAGPGDRVRPQAQPWQPQDAGVASAAGKATPRGDAAGALTSTMGR
jgi:hypothetical protein